MGDTDVTRALTAPMGPTKLGAILPVRLLANVLKNDNCVKVRGLSPVATDCKTNVAGGYWMFWSHGRRSLTDSQTYSLLVKRCITIWMLR